MISEPPDADSPSTWRGPISLNGDVSLFMSGLNDVRLSITHCPSALVEMRHWPTVATGTPLTMLRPQLRQLSGKSAACSVSPRSTRARHWVFPTLPRLVLITMTPLAAWVPYRAAADGPLMMSIDSMSSGAIEAVGFAVLFPFHQSKLAEFMRTPSMTHSGSFDRPMLFTPRTRIEYPAPLMPYDGMTW